MRTVTILLALGALACSGAPADTDSSTPPADGGPRDATMTEMDATLPDSGPPDAGPEPCATEGMTRTVECGNCGLASEQCTGGVWSRTSACLDEGECAPGTVGTEMLERCGERQRICNDMCMWRDWTMTAPQGECEVGERQLVTTSACGVGFQPQRCNDACAWEDEGACDDGCGSTARTTPEWAREVCVPAGPFIRGHVGDYWAEPVREIRLSAYYVDAYPVTNRRYRQCVTAGSCSPPQLADEFNNSTYEDIPVIRLTPEQAAEFCAWDGGRRLPTQAEWEKAARGPSPRAQRWVWDGDTYRCDLVLVPGCPGGPPADVPLRDRYDALPGSRSHYGTFRQFAGGLEWVSDYFRTDWYSDAASGSDDPTGPSPTGFRTYVGTSRSETGLMTRGISQRGGIPLADASNGQFGMRCARRVGP